MKLNKETNIVLSNPETRPFLADAFYPDVEGKFPLLIFVHGYKGYKDWGAWNLMAEKIAEAGFFFVKFNFSHNGTTLEKPSDFSDLEAFGENNYSKEISDLKFVVEHFIHHPKVDSGKIGIVGHSRGGGLSAIEAFEDERFNYLIVLASVDSLDRFPKEKAFDDWKNNGVYYSLNGRTKQEMPHYFQFFEDFDMNKKRFDVESAIEQIKAKILIIHGTSDESVNMVSSEKLQQWSSDAELFLVEGANHTFGAKEPWESDVLPKDLEIATNKIISFITKK